MKKNTLLTSLAVVSIVGSIAAFADQIHDWKGLNSVLSHIVEARKELNQAAKDNHYDMGGHSAKAEQLLGEAENELHLAEESAKAAH